MNQVLNGRYTLHQKLGQGGMGIVHRATDRLTGETVALKQVFLPVEQIMFASRPISQSNRELRLALAHEFQVLAGLRHPNIISVLDYGFDEKQQPFFTMSYLEGAKTIVAAANGRSVPEKITLLLQTLEALAYLHRRGILHRDLKPDNVLVVGDTVRVLDFGLAAAKEQATESVGSWLYMAPEVLLGQPASEGSDLYTVGVLAYRLLAGTHPFDIYAEDTIGEILEGEPDWGKMGVGGELTAVVRTLLAKQPTDRYTSAKQVIAALYHALGQRVPGETAVIRESYLQAATFVGRETEMVQLTAALNQAAKGSGSAWLIGGESGVGKTRLISELRTQALVSGFQVLRGQTVEDGGLPYQAWRQPVRHLVATSPDVDDLAASVLLPLVPDIAQLLNRPVAPAPELKEDAAQSRLFTTIARLFWRAERPLLLILEDLHLAQASLLPLPYLTRLVGDYPLLILGSYRSDDLPDLPDPLKTMTPLPLHRLSPAALTALSTAMLGESGQAEAIQSLLQRETEGNAFFAVEVVRALAEEAGHLGNIGQMILPQTLLPNGIRDIVQRRVDKLPEWAYPLLVKTAVAGRELNLPLVQQMADGIDVETKWLPLCADTAVLEVQDGTWQFTHSKIRDGLLATITQKQLEETHRQVAEAMVQLFNNAPERAGQLAYHWEAAGHHAKAAKAAFQAGQYAADQYANNEALHYLTQAFNLTPPQKLVQRYDILQKRQTVYELTGDSPSQKADLALLQAIADQLDDVEKQIVVQLLHANYLQNQAKFHEGIAIVATAVSRANQSNNPQLVAQGQLIWASLLENISDYTASFEHALKAKQIYETLDLRGHELYRSTLYKIASLYMRQEELDKTEQYLSQLRELDNNQYQKALMLDLLAIVKQRQGNHEKSEELSQAALAIMRAIGAKRSELKILNNLAAFCIDTNQHELAQKYQMQIMQLLREIGYSVAEAMNYGNIGLVQLLLGQLESSRKYCEIAIQISREIGHQYALATALSVVGQLYRTLGEVELARSVNEEGLRLKQAMNQPSEVVYILNNMGNLALDMEDWAAAEAHFKQSLKVLATIEFPEYTAEAHGGLTAVYANTHRLDLVSEHLEAALAYVMTQPLHGYWEPFQTALNIYEVLITNRDSRAFALLRRAYQSLQEQANALTEPENRRSFLENLPANKQVVALFEQFETEGWPEWKTAVFPTHHDREQDD